MKVKTTLHVSESFHSIQGEGLTTGTPAIFLRLSGCNLLCQGRGWRCDTIEVWRKGVRIPFKDVLPREHIKYLKRGAHLVITGGEPLLHQVALQDYLVWFLAAYNFLPFVEIETNGTLEPSSFMMHRVNLWNCSPKLANSGEDLHKRFNLKAIKKINELNSIFKFVICNSRDINEIRSRWLGSIDRERVYLMPAGSTREELKKTQELTVDLVKKFYLKYSDRIHIGVYDKKTGV